MPEHAARALRIEARPWTLGFWSLIATQFQGGFSDNALKWIISFLILGLGLPQLQRDRLFVLMVPLLFSVPFILFSMPGGYLADRYSKRTVVIGTKFFEIGVVLAALPGLLAAQPGDPMRRRLSDELAGCCVRVPRSTACCRSFCRRNASRGATASSNLGRSWPSFSAPSRRAFLTPIFPGREYASGIVLARPGHWWRLATSFGISRVPAAKPDAQFRWNPLGDLFSQIAEIRKDRVLSLRGHGKLYFWFLGSLLLINVVLYGTDVLHVSESAASRLLVASSMGIGFGSFLAGYLSGGKIEYGLIPLGAIGITVTIAASFAHGIVFRPRWPSISLSWDFSRDSSRCRSTRSSSTGRRRTARAR